MPGVVNSNCYAGYSDPAQAQRDEFEDADRYNYAVLFLANPVNDARSNGWFFPNDGVINVDHQTPCADSDSVDLEYSRLALETFASFEQVDGGKVFTKGFSQNSMWSAVLGVCFPDKVLRFAQGGSGLAIRGAAVTPPGSQSECTQSSRAEHGRDCVTDHPCDGTNGEPLCTWWPIYPKGQTEVLGGAPPSAPPPATTLSPLQSCGFVYEGDYLFSTQLPMYDALVAEGHQARYLSFPGGQHKMPSNANDWLVGCLGIQDKCSAECEADIVSCVGGGGADAFKTCMSGASSGGRPSSCRAACAPTLAMLSSSETPSAVKVSAGTFDAWPEQGERARKSQAVTIRGRIVSA